MSLKILIVKWRPFSEALNELQRWHQYSPFLGLLLYHHNMTGASLIESLVWQGTWKGFIWQKWSQTALLCMVWYKNISCKSYFTGIYVSTVNQHCFMSWLGTCTPPSHCQKQSKYWKNFEENWFEIAEAKKCWVLPLSSICLSNTKLYIWKVNQNVGR